MIVNIINENMIMKYITFYYISLTCKKINLMRTALKKLSHESATNFNKNCDYSSTTSIVYQGQ